MKILALLVRFLLELAALTGLCYAGIHLVSGPVGWLVGLLALAVAATLWGLFVAPRARIRRSTPFRLTVEIVVFLAAAGGLAAAGRLWPAVILFAVYVLDRLWLLALGAPLFQADPMGNTTPTGQRSGTDPAP